jgi:general secretion pathway protein J
VKACRNHIGRGGSEAGFTLLELLVATTVLAFLSLLLFGGLSFGTRVWEKTETSATDTNHIRAAQLALSQDIAQIYPFYAGATATDKHVDFQGEDQRMTFLAPSKTLIGGMDLVTVQAQPGKSGVSLVEARRVELDGGRDVPTHHTLIGGLKWVQISYYGAPAPAGTSIAKQPTQAKAGLGANAASKSTAPPQWTSVWIGQQTLPQLIRIRARLKGKDSWPDLVASPRTDVDESCVLDETTNYCQGR